MSKIPSQYVKQGMWVNLEDGPVIGRTITTDTRTGNLVVALMTVFTAFGTTHLWNLGVFCFHQSRVNQSPTDGLYRQQQVLLRSLPTPSTLMSDLLKLWMVWRKVARGTALRLVPQILIAALFTALTVAAGIFTSYVVSTSNVQVLAKSSHCGPLDYDDWPSALSTYCDKVKATAQSYVDECYIDLNTTLPERCTTYVKPRITFAEERTRCPFNDSICLNFEKPGITMDSGLIDMNNGFGFNLLSRDRMKYRKKMSCAPLNVSGHYDVASRLPSWMKRMRKQQPGEEYLTLHFGDDVEHESNLTWAISLLNSNITASYQTIPFMKFESQYFSDSNSISTPLPELATDEADLAVVMILKNLIQYYEPVDDPVFSAHKSMNGTGTGGVPHEVYVSDFPVSVIGCHTQYQLCFSNSSSKETCTPLAGLRQSVSELGLTGLSAAQTATTQLLLTMSKMLDLGEISLVNLKAAEIVHDRGYLQSLPNDQWVQEIRNWESNIWANLQIAITDYAIGVGAREPTADYIVRRNQTVGEQKLCGVQKMRNPGGFVNINVFGLAFVLTFCCVISTIDLVLVRFLIYTKTSKKMLPARINAWLQDGVFQLQRRVYEANEEGEWDRVDKEVPVTVTAVELPALSTRPVRSSPVGPSELKSIHEKEDRTFNESSTIHNSRSDGTKVEEVPEESA